MASSECDQFFNLLCELLKDATRSDEGEEEAETVASETTATADDALAQVPSTAKHLGPVLQALVGRLVQLPVVEQRGSNVPDKVSNCQRVLPWCVPLTMCACLWA